ncbi:MAG TPA: 3-deoxy-D-manno-octulosonic acid transferase [Terriglobales bacterium]|nr:3-deoxy-D-manno-octulosonic acid transferase [Terriglobales bacterium]
MYFLYSLAAGAAALLLAPWWLWKMLRHGKYRAGLSERLGRVPERLALRRQNAPPPVWIHAVSVGEVLAMSPVIAELRRQMPERRVFISTTTRTGQSLARERFGAGNVFYFPLDFAFAIRPYLRALRPALVVLAETEFWPNFLLLAHASGARVAVVNARISDRSLPGYKRWRGLLHRILGNVDVFLAQSGEDARRLVEIGAEAARVSVAGNLKFDAGASSASVAPLLRNAIQGNAERVIVAGSTLAGEEEIVLAAFRQVLAARPASLLVLAPRHPERFAAAADLVAASGLRHWRRTALNESTELSGGVLLLDTIGELAALYEFADVAFVGGSLAPAGGHNVIEPARHGIAILVGPHTENFRDMVATFQRAGALRVVTGQELAPTLLHLLEHDGDRLNLGARAKQVVDENAGATARTIAALERLLTANAAAPAAATGSARVPATREVAK